MRRKTREKSMERMKNFLLGKATEMNILRVPASKGKRLAPRRLPFWIRFRKNWQRKLGTSGTRLETWAQLLLTLKRNRALILSCLVITAMITVVVIRNIDRKDETSDKPVQLVDQYRKQLKELESKAKSGSANDLQNYGIALYATGDLAKAEEIYRKQLSVDGENAVAHNNLANTLRDEKKFEEAAAAYERAIKFSPQAANPYMNLASLYQYSLKDIDKAIKVYERGMESNPKVVDFPNLIGLAYEQKEDSKKAEEFFKKALVIQSDNQTAKAGLERLQNKSQK